MVGEDFSDFESYHVDTKKRIKMLGVLIHIPVLLWGFIGYQIASDIFNTPFFFSILSAFGFGLGIFAVEYSILQLKTSSFKKHWKQTISAILTRLIIAILLSFIGSYIIDFKVFNREISEQLDYDYQVDLTKAINSQKYSLAELSNLENSIRHDIDNLSQDFIKENSGKGISGKAGVGPNAITLQQRIDEKSKQLDITILEHKRNTEQIDSVYKNDVLTANAKKTNPGLLAMKTALDKYLVANPSANILFWSIFLFMFILEFLVLLAKLFSAETVDDQKSELQSVLILEEAKTRNDIRLKKLSVVKDTYDPRLKKVQDILQSI